MLLPTGYLKENNFTAAEQAFTEECPYLSPDEEARPSESLEEIVGIYKKQKQYGGLIAVVAAHTHVGNTCTQAHSPESTSQHPTQS